MHGVRLVPFLFPSACASPLCDRLFEPPCGAHLPFQQNLICFGTSNARQHAHWKSRPKGGSNRTGWYPPSCPFSAADGSLASPLALLHVDQNLSMRSRPEESGLSKILRSGLGKSNPAACAADLRRLSGGNSILPEGKYLPRAKPERFAAPSRVKLPGRLKGQPAKLGKRN